MNRIKDSIVVSHEMISHWGPGKVATAGWPTDSVLLSFAAIDGDTALLRFDAAPVDAGEEDGADVVLVVQRAACLRLFGGVPASGHWHLPSCLRALALGISRCDAPDQARDTLRLARSIELLCQAFAELTKGELLAAEGDGVLSELDAARIAAARRLIDERWREKLTLDAIARACGLNRDKLSRGFRTVFRTTVADALAERRLEGARTMILTTGLPVSTIGYRCGYLNNASFARAFTRRFGMPPTRLRQMRGSAAA